MYENSPRLNKTFIHNFKRFGAGVVFGARVVIGAWVIIGAETSYSDLNFNQFN